MVKIRFREDRVVQDCLQGTPHETRFLAGQVVDLSEASANHWLSRGVAERLQGDDAAGATQQAPTGGEQPALGLVTAAANGAASPSTDDDAGLELTGDDAAAANENIYASDAREPAEASTAAGGEIGQQEASTVAGGELGQPERKAGRRAGRG
jgi:hypothetical protein